MQTLTKNKYLSEAECAEFRRVILEMLAESPDDPTLIEIAENFETTVDGEDSIVLP